MVFFRALTLVALPLLAVATAIQGRAGDAECCESLSSASDPATANLLSSLGISAEGITGLVGIGCSPITVIGVGPGSCGGGTTTVTCTDNSHATVSLGCVPVTL